MLAFLRTRLDPCNPYYHLFYNWRAISLVLIVKTTVRFLTIMHLQNLLVGVFLSIASLSSAFVIPDDLSQFPAPHAADFVKRQQSPIPYGIIITHCNSPGVVALTFDDGPYIYTGQMLDTLSQHGARVTFFLNGVNKGNIEAFPELVQRAVNEGHQLGSHTYVSQSITSPSPKDQDTNTEHSRKSPKFFRMLDLLRKYPLTTHSI